MKRIEAEDPERRLAGLEHSLKGKDRLTEKVDQWVSAQANLYTAWKPRRAVEVRQHRRRP
jgi:hypothetical protein